MSFPENPHISCLSAFLVACGPSPEETAGAVLQPVSGVLQGGSEGSPAQ